jgi:predicted metal-dependent hydrolase
VSGIPVEIVRKKIKNLHLGVYPPHGRVRVAAPLQVSDDAVRLAVTTRLGWVRRQQNRFQSQARQSPREMVSGETHYFRGQRYSLDVIETVDKVGVRRRTNNRLELRVRPGASKLTKERILSDWYRQALREHANGLIRKWAPRVGVEVAEWGIRKMKTRWGTCDRAAGRIWLNLELAKKSPSCVELIVVHELVHLRLRRHDESFTNEMTRHLSSWRNVREELNREPLSHADWNY